MKSDGKFLVRNQILQYLKVCNLILFGIPDCSLRKWMPTWNSFPLYISCLFRYSGERIDLFDICQIKDNLLEIKLNLKFCYWTFYFWITMKNSPQLQPWLRKSSTLTKYGSVGYRSWALKHFVKFYSKPILYNTENYGGVGALSGGVEWGR